MEHFGVKDLNELPNATELREVSLPKATPPGEFQPATNVEMTFRPTSKPENTENGEVKVITGRDPEAH
jgi:hypothetical protein